MRRLPAVLLLALLPSAAAAQAARTVPDTVFTRAQRLVTGGNGADGRAIVDSVLRAVPPGSADYAEALYWRAALAETAAEAERAYLRLAVEYPLAPRTDAALFRLGQLELTRGNTPVARGRFERIVTDFPDSPLVGRAQLSLARLHLEARRAPEGCRAVGAGQAAAPAADVELVNQLGYLERQCRAAGVATTAATTAAAAADVAAEEPARDPAPRDEPAPAERVPGERAPAERAAERTPPPDTARPAPAAARPPARAPRPAARSTTAPGFSVQVAAFDRAQPATAVVAELKADGWDARVDRDGAWHRVRVGRWATRAEAAAAVKRLATQGVTGFVTGVGGR